MQLKRSKTAREAAPNNYIQNLGYFLAEAKLTGDELAERSHVPRYRISGMLNGTVFVTEDDALALAPVLRCDPEELVSLAPAGIRISGAAIFETHDLRGERLPDARPLTLRAWKQSWRELDVEGILPADGVTAGPGREEVAASIDNASPSPCVRAA